MSETTRRAAEVVHEQVHWPDTDNTACNDCYDAVDALRGHGLLATDEVKAEVWEEGFEAGEGNTRIVSGDPDSNPYERRDDADA